LEGLWTVLAGWMVGVWWQEVGKDVGAAVLTVAALNGEGAGWKLG